MDREQVTNEILAINNKNVLCLLPTSFGKTRVALERVKSVKKKSNILIAVPRLVLIQNWKDEFIKWGMKSLLPRVTFTTYVSLYKHTGKWDVAIFDECHHLSEKCREDLSTFEIENSILLSATVKASILDELYSTFCPLSVYKVTTKEAIDNEVLPDPKVFLIPLHLENNSPTESIFLNPKANGRLVEVAWAQRGPFLKQKRFPIRIFCTEQNYYDSLCGKIDSMKALYIKTKNIGMKNRWLHLCGQRLSWLATKKNAYILSLLDKLGNERTLTFCNNISQTEILGKHCINSKNKASTQVLTAFNEGKIDHITACNMLNEGMNLINCRIGVYANLNSSETIIKQRLGRILRHKDPIIIIPYYVGTREEELVDNMLADYNPALVTKVSSLTDIKI